MPRFLLICLSVFLTTASVRADKLELIAGGGTGGTGGKATDAKLGEVFGYDQDAAGNGYIIEFTNKFWKIDPKGTIQLIAGDGEKGYRGDGGPAAEARLNIPHALAVHRPTGEVYIADTGNYRVRKYDPKTGIISTFAGTGKKAAAGDNGPAKEASFGSIFCVSFDPTYSKLIVSDLDFKQVRSIDMKTGMVTLVAGNTRKGLPADGSDAKESPLVDPRAACADGSGNVYILERSGNALRAVDSSGKIRTLAGTGKVGNTGDGSPAREATMNGPKHLCMRGEHAILIGDAENYVVRELDLKTGVITRFAGTGKKGLSPAGLEPTQTALNRPHGVFVSPEGTVYLCDTMNGRVFRVVK